MFKFVTALLAKKLVLTEEMQKPISEVYRTFLRAGKINRDEVLMLKIADHVYLSIEPEPEWMIGEEETLAETIARRKQAYQIYAEAYNTSIHALGSCFENTKPKNLPLLTQNHPEEILLCMNHEHGVLHIFDGEKTGESSPDFLEEVGEDDLFHGHVKTLVMDYRDIFPSFSPVAEEEIQHPLYLHAMRAMGQAAAVNAFSPAVRRYVSRAGSWWLSDSVREHCQEKVEFFLRHSLNILVFILQRAHTNAENKKDHVSLLSAFAHHADRIVRFVQHGIANTGAPEKEKYLQFATEHLFLQAVRHKALPIVRFFLIKKIHEAAKIGACTVMAQQNNPYMVPFFMRHGIKEDLFFMSALSSKHLPTIRFFLESVYIEQATKEQVFIRFLETPYGKPIGPLLLLFLQSAFLTQESRDKVFIALLKPGYLRGAEREQIASFLQNFLLEEEEKDAEEKIKAVEYHCYLPIVQFIPKIAEADCYTPILKLLLNQEPTLKENNKALIAAAYYNHFALLEFLLKKDTTENAQENALIAAAQQGYLPILQHLLKQERGCAAKDHALIIATQHNHVSIVQFLLESEWISQVGKNHALLVAAHHGYVCLVNMLQKDTGHRAKNCALVEAASCNHKGVVDSLLLHDFTREIIDEALAKAIEKNNTAIVAYLKVYEPHEEAVQNTLPTREEDMEEHMQSTSPTPDDAETRMHHVSPRVYDVSENPFTFLPNSSPPALKKGILPPPLIIPADAPSTVVQLF